MSTKKRVVPKRNRPKVNYLEDECGDSSSKRIEAACVVLSDGLLALPADAKDWCAGHVTAARECIAGALDVLEGVCK